MLREAKNTGFRQGLGQLLGLSEMEVRGIRKKHKILPVYKIVDTCAAEFAAFTPYLYSCYERPFYRLAAQKRGSAEATDFQTSELPNLSAIADSEANPTDRQKVIILGSGPNRIGQGVEFDYCCVHAVFALRELGYETIMTNCNPETVSTDYDTSDRLYFEPLTIEDTLNIIETEKPLGVIVQVGGQTPLKLAVPLSKGQDTRYVSDSMGPEDGAVGILINLNWKLAESMMPVIEAVKAAEIGCQ
jgi:carbamoyl-phosphate synthase large subunit